MTRKGAAGIQFGAVPFILANPGNLNSAIVLLYHTAHMQV
jgi:hypothetical protein